MHVLNGYHPSKRSQRKKKTRRKKAAKRTTQIHSVKNWLEIAQNEMKARMNVYKEARRE